MSNLYYIGQEGIRHLLDSDLGDIDKARLFALIGRYNTLYMIARAGSGHIGSSFSSMDIFSYLHLNVLGENDIFFSSKGHDAPGLYAVLIGLGKLDFDSLHKLRRLHGLPGHPDVGTPCMETNTGSLGMGVSKAKGMVRAMRLDDRKGRVFVLTGDGELQEGQFWESLPGAVNGCFDEITVIVDHNKIQSDTWVTDVCDLGDLETRLASYGWHVQRCDGNDMVALSAAIEATRDVTGKPQIIIADTIKGCGVSFMEATAMSENQEFYTFHSGAPSVEDYESAAQELLAKLNKAFAAAGMDGVTPELVERQTSSQTVVTMQRLIPAYEQALCNAGQDNQDLVVLDADLMIDCGLLGFRNRFPERFVECGIAEQDMVSQAGALALQGKLPVAHSFACFLATRANEQIFNNASERTRCIYAGSLAGLLPSGPGHSHQMVRDISALGGVPGLTLLEPCCEEEVGMIVDYAVNKNPSSTYIRLVSIPYEKVFELPKGYTLQEGKGVALNEGGDAVIFSYGPVMLAESIKASLELSKLHGIGLKVVNLPWLNRFDLDWMLEEIGECSLVISLDNHLLDGGQGERIAAVLMEGGMQHIQFKRLGLSEIPECGHNQDVMSYYGLDSVGLVKSVRAYLEGCQ